MAIKPIKVSQLNGYIKRVLQSDPLLGNVSVIGEISNLKYHGTGHVYFTMKDDNSKINCFLASDNLKNIRFELSDGMEIIAEGYIYLYEKGGTYSLNVRDISVEGVGNLTVAFEKLKDKLSKEGLFDEKYKKKIPFFPKKVAVITSETGAAVRDILKIIQSRNNIVDVLVYPCQVQGVSAAIDIANAIKAVNNLYPETDTIIVGRGGGSIEELWAFNEEVVARSIFDSKIPVISAVGHETDFTIADFVADKRAETPTAAAQMAVPDIGMLREYTNNQKINLVHSFDSIFRYFELRVKNNNISALRTGLLNRIKIMELEINGLKNEIYNSSGHRIKELEATVLQQKNDLEAYNPRNIMERGYAAVLDKKGKLLNSTKSLSEGDRIITVMKDGELDCEVKGIRRLTIKSQEFF